MPSDVTYLSGACLNAIFLSGACWDAIIVSGTRSAANVLSGARPYNIFSSALSLLQYSMNCGSVDNVVSRLLCLLKSRDQNKGVCWKYDFPIFMFKSRTLPDVWIRKNINCLAPINSDFPISRFSGCHEV